MTAQRRIPTDIRLRDSPEDKVGLLLPAAISARVDALVALTEEAGDRTNRKELITSLILAAPPVAEELARILRRFRQATVRDSLLKPEDSGPVIYVPIHPRGPRRRTRR